MKAAQLVEFQKPLQVNNVPDPTPGPNDVVIRVEAEGVCRTDWHLWNGGFPWLRLVPNLPIIMGHEMAGVVEVAGRDVRSFKADDRVLVPLHEGCGYCSYCQNGLPNLCDNIQIHGITHNGGYAEFARITNADYNCIAMPESVDPLSAAALGCRYMTAYHAVTERGNVKPGQWVVVYGAGGVGLAAVQIANAMGAQVIAVSHDEAKLAKAREEGAVATVSAHEEDVPQAVKEISKGGAHVAIEAVGTAETTLNGLLSLRKRGRLVQVGATTHAEKGMVTLPVDLIFLFELEIVGSIGNPHPRYDELLAMIESGKLHPRSLVTREIALEEAGAVIESMTNYQTLGYNIISKF